MFGDEGDSFNQDTNPIDMAVYPFTVFVTNYPTDINPNSVINFIQSNVQNSLHKKLEIYMKTLWADGISFSLPNQIQAAAVLNLMGTRFHNQHLWVIRFPGDLKNDSPIFSRVFQKNYHDGIMDLSNLFDKLTAEAPNGFTFNINIQEHVEYLFYRLGQEAKENNVIIKSLRLRYNYITMLDQLDRLLWFLPGLLELDLTGNTLMYGPMSRTFPNVQIKCSVPGTFDPNKKKKSWNAKDSW